MTSLEGPDIAHTSFTVERDDAKHRVERRHTANAVSHKQATHTRQRKRDVNYAPVYEVLEVKTAPKWRRHQEDYINPHLLPHERDPIAPRYGPDSVCKRLRPTNDDRRFKCRCEYCVPTGHLRVQENREMNVALRKVVASPGSGRARVGRSGTGPWVDWDWNGQNDPFACTSGDEDWRLDYQVDKCAPAPTLDLLSMAKPAKGRKKASRVAPGPSARSLALARAFLEPVASGSGSLPDIDEISILDFEETWEHLDLDRLDLGIDDESEWERFSQL